MKCNVSVFCFYSRLLDVVGGGEESGSQVTQTTHLNWTSMVRMVRMVQISRVVGSLLEMVGMVRVLRIMKVVRLTEMAIIKKKWAKKKKIWPHCGDPPP